jgi:hypothetical protein
MDTTNTTPADETPSGIFNGLIQRTVGRTRRFMRRRQAIKLSNRRRNRRHAADRPRNSLWRRLKQSVGLPSGGPLAAHQEKLS